jgi:hypothetical protein
MTSFRNSILAVAAAHALEELGCVVAGAVFEDEFDVLDISDYLARIS